MHYNNVDNDPPLIFVGWMYETGVVLALDEQRVRFIAAFGLVIGIPCGRAYERARTL